MSDEPEDDIDFIVDRRREPKESPRLYVLAVVVMVFFVIAAIVVIAVFRPEQKDVITSIVAFVGPTLLVLMNLMKQQDTHASVSQLRDALNGHLRDYVRATRERAIEEGKRAPRVPRPGQQPADQG